MFEFETKRIGFFDYAILLICAFLTLKRVNVLFPSIFIVSSLLIGCLCLFFLTKSKSGEKSISLLIFYSLILLFNFLLGDHYFDSLGDIVQEITLLYLTTRLTYYVFTERHIKMAVSLILLVMVIVVYYCVSSFLLNMESPGLIRESVPMINLGYEEQLKDLWLRGLSTYQFPHSLPIIIPSIVLVMKENTKNKKIIMIGVFFLVAIMVLAFISYAATALFMSILVLVLSLVIKEGAISANMIKLFIIGLVLLLFITSPFLLNPLMRLFGLADGTSYIDKFTDILSFLDSGTASGSIALREDKYQITFDLIFSNLLLGTNETVGGHSTIFDRLACLGLVGWIPFMLFLYRHFKFILQNIDYSKRIYYYLGVFAALFMLFTKNMGYWETWLMVLVVLPLMIWLTSQISLNNTNKS